MTSRARRSPTNFFSANRGSLSLTQSRFNRLYSDFQVAAQAGVTNAWTFYYGLSIWKRILLLALGTCSVGATIVLIIFHKEVQDMFVAFAEVWKDMKSGPYIMFLLITLISFPPLLGYSTLSVLCGMMYGFPGGWPLLAFSTLFGSVCSFLTFKYFLSGFATKLARSNTKFTALTKTLENDNIVLLTMIRLCPLPYSLSNGALASIPTVSVKSFFIASLIASPKLMVHIFIGDRLMKLGKEKDTATKVIDLISISLAGIMSVVTAYLIYVRTIEKAEHLDSIYQDVNERDENELDLELDDVGDDLIDEELLSQSDHGQETRV